MESRTQVLDQLADTRSRLIALRTSIRGTDLDEETRDALASQAEDARGFIDNIIALVSAETFKPAQPADPSPGNGHNRQDEDEEVDPVILHPESTLKLTHYDRTDDLDDTGNGRPFASGTLAVLKDKPAQYNT